MQQIVTGVEAKHMGKALLAAFDVHANGIVLAQGM
jgi:hypothetical protein